MLDETSLAQRLAAELLAGVVAALAFGFLSRTPADRAPAPAIDLGDPQSAVDAEAGRIGAVAS